jgi:hypothetical protein
MLPGKYGILASSALLRLGILEPPSRESSMLSAANGGATDEDLELIDLRYQRWVALMDLEEIFANGRLDYL